MTDLAPLHRRLRRALDLSAMLALGALAPACASTSTPDQDVGQGKTEVTKTEVIKTEVIKTEVTKIDPIKAEPLEPEPPKLEPEPPKLEPTITITKHPPEPRSAPRDWQGRPLRHKWPRAPRRCCEVARSRQSRPDGRPIRSGSGTKRFACARIGCSSRIEQWRTT